MKGRMIGILVLFVWGLIKMPLESSMSLERERQRLGGFKLTASLREQAGQAGFVAVLGGLRAVVADLLWIQAHMAWEKTEYGRMKVYFDICTALQPRRENYWDIAAWHMAWNAAAYVQLHDETITDEHQREREIRKYWKVGEDYLMHGIQNNPDSWLLYERLGGFYRDKLKDNCQAAWAYGEAAKRPGHLTFVRRFHAMYLAECPGHEREGYEKLLVLYQESEREWLPGLLASIRKAEEKLGIPKEQRLDIPPQKQLPPHK
jgi:hypothetical protein